ncbi:MAG TPA: ATP-binding cassette domain-containing protein [Candidatus Cloacimonadota bacterium]|nr:ATP-binding cassette domain-containing protein [Candidatus Cloacimonadota bacterium]
MNFHSKKAKSENTLISFNIHDAIVSVFINIARIRKVEKRHIEILAKLFRNTLSYEPSLLSLWEIAEKPYTLRQSCHIFNQSFSKNDKIKLFLNIIFLVYAEEDFNVLSSLEIIKIIDLLYLDISLYEQVLDFIEGKTLCLSLKTSLFFQENRILQNDILLGNDKHFDILLLSSNLVILNILNHVFVGFNHTNKWFMNDMPLASDVFYLLQPDDKLSCVCHDNNILILNKSLIQKLYQRRQNHTEFSYLYHGENCELEIQIKALKTSVTLVSGKALYQGKKFKKLAELALDDQIHSPNPAIGINLIFGEIDQINQVESVYLLSQNMSRAYRYQQEELTLSEIEGNSCKDRNQSFLALLKPVRQTSDSDNKVKLIIEDLSENITLFVNGNMVCKGSIIQQYDLIQFNSRNYMINQYLQLDELKQFITSFKVHEIYHEFSSGQKIALDNIHFQLESREMLAIMGPSGSGKTTFLKCLLGEIIPNRMKISINHENYLPAESPYRKTIAYVPQDDLLFENLSIWQNLYYCAKIRVPDLFNDKNDILLEQKIKHILSIMGLWDKRHLKAGSVHQKTLSGGERKRLNIALELLSDPQIIILDEPTSGLSSKDSEKLLETLNDLKQIGKMIIATIHQPNAELFQQFDKLLLLDKGGIQVYFGDTQHIFNYFDEELALIQDQERLSFKRNLKMPEYLFDILEYSQRNHYGVNRFVGFSERKFSPLYWKEKYRNARILELIQTSSKNGEREIPVDQKSTINSIKTRSNPVKKNFYLFLRNLINKCSNPTNIIISLLAAPVLGLLIAFIFRYVNPEDSTEYSMYFNPNISLFIFISIIIFIFLGMAASVNDILSEKLILNRERKINVLIPEFYASKFLFLALLVIIQSVLYLLVSMPVLNVKGIFNAYLLFLFLSGLTGVSIGLFLSSVFKDRDSATNLMPYLLIPQILFAGAVISFSEINPSVKLDQQKSVPEFCEVIPSRWLFEGLAVAQVEENYRDKMINRLSEKAKTAKTSDKKSEYYTKMNNLTKNHLKQNYQNKKLSQLVFLQNGKSRNLDKYQFMSSKRLVFRHELDVSKINVIVVLLIITGVNICALISLKISLDKF